jgi:RNA polymerase sigma-70 factor (ECF subfamily)
MQLQDPPANAAEEISDGTLMRRFCESLDDATFHTLASRYYDKALRIAKERLGSDSAAQDAVQEAMIRIVRFRKRYSPAKPFAPWFYAVLRNVCTDLYRKELRHQEALNAFAETPRLLGVDESAMARVHDLTAGLSPGEVEILRLRFVDGLSLNEIGWQLQCSLDAAKKRLQRLLKRLKR